MGEKQRINSIFLIMVLLAVAGVFGSPMASAQSMEKIEAQFRWETGMDWDSATSDQKKEFLSRFKSARNDSESTVSASESDEVNVIHGTSLVEDREERPGYYIREAFRKKHRMKWEDADEKMQEKFLQEYEREQEKFQRAEEKRKRNAEQRQLRKDQAKEREKQRAFIKKQKRELAEAKIQLERERRKQKTQQRLQRAQEKILQKRRQLEAQRLR